MHSAHIVTAAMMLVAAAALLAVPVSADGQDVAVIGESGYGSLAEAVHAAEPGAVVVMTGDDPSTGDVVLDRSVTIEGRGHSFGGSLVLGASEQPLSVTVTDLVITSGSVSSADRSAASEVVIDGCTVAGGVDLSGVGEVALDDCTFPAGASVRVAGSSTVFGMSRCVFTGEHTGTPVELSGTMTSVSVSGTDFRDSEGIDVSVPLSCHSVDVSPRGETRVSFGGLLVTSSSDMTCSGGVMRVVGTASVSGEVPDGMTAEAMGLITLSDIVGTVWFDSSHTHGITSDAGGCSLSVDNLGMVVEGITCSGSTVVHGTFTVDSDLAVGGSLTIPADSRITTTEHSRMEGGSVSNLGVLDVYGHVSCDIDNRGTVNAHRGSSLTGSVTGNPVVEPVPAAVTMVLQAKAGREFSIVLSPDEGTVITGAELPDWMVLDGTTLVGVPPSEGVYDVTVTASASEYNITLQYRIEVSPADQAPSGPGWNWTVIVVVLVAAIIVIALLTLGWAGIIGPRRS